MRSLVTTIGILLCIGLHTAGYAQVLQPSPDVHSEHLIGSTISLGLSYAYQRGTSSEAILSPIYSIGYVHSLSPRWELEASLHYLGRHRNPVNSSSSVLTNSTEIRIGGDITLFFAPLHDSTKHLRFGIGPTSQWSAAVRSFYGYIYSEAFEIGVHGKAEYSISLGDHVWLGCRAQVHTIFRDALYRAIDYGYDTSAFPPIPVLPNSSFLNVQNVSFGMFLQVRL
jgi:hypothetical protein